MVHTSLLQRAVRTWYNIADELDLHWIEHYKDWRLNERHYGALQGLNKAETAAKYGDEQVKIWRRSYDIAPPELDMRDHRHPRYEIKYKSIPAELLPRSESLKTTVKRVVPYWTKVIQPQI